jgi:cobalt-zinc-cadmium efflux system protein
MADQHNHDDHPGQGHGEHEGHDHGVAASDSRLRWALALTAGFMGLEVAAGLWSGSLALIADAGHMLTDAGSLALALYAAAVSRREADASRTYGYGRARVLAAFVNGLALLLIAAWIMFEAVQRLRDPVQILAGPMLAVAFSGLIVNVGAYFILRSGGDLNTRSALAHVIGDMLGSVAAIVAAGIILVTGWTPADPLLSVAVALLIVRTGWRITRDSAHMLLEGAPHGFDEAHIRDSIVNTVPGILGVHHVHAWTVGPDEPHMTLHLQVAETVEADDVIAVVRLHLSENFSIRHVTVQVEYQGCAAVDSGRCAH